MPDIQNSTDETTSPVIIDTGRCRAELHPLYGVILIGAIASVEHEGEAVIIPAR